MRPYRATYRPLVGPGIPVVVLSHHLPPPVDGHVFAGPSVLAVVVDRVGRHYIASVYELTADLSDLPVGPGAPDTAEVT